MVLTAAQIAAFFHEEAQMGIPNPTIAQMQAEGITNVQDLADFDKDSLQQMADNLRKPGGRVPDPNPNAAPGATIPTPAFVFGAKSQKRLFVATDLVKYYHTTGRDYTAANLQWNNVMKNFEVQWKALKVKQKEESPETPKISKALPVIKWTEAFRDFLYRVVGVRTIPLCYVIRDTVHVPATAPALAQNQPHSNEHESVEGELVARASHEHALFRDDNASVYHYLEEATRSTTYAASIKPFQRRKDGRGAWLALLGQYAGNDKWEAEIKIQESVLHTRIWKGQSNFSLESFISQHRHAYVSMEACAEHIQYQLPNEHSRVGFLLDAIQNSDAGLQAAIASVRTDNGPTGKRNDFEATATHLLPYDPVAKKRLSGNKRGAGMISEVVGMTDDAQISGTTGGKPAIGKTGVHLRYYKKHEYDKLSKEQKDELREWRKDHNVKPASTSDGKDKKKSYTKKQLASLVSKKVKLQLDKSSEEMKTQDETKAYIMSLIKETLENSSPKAQTSAASASVPTLHSILKRAKNPQT
jgi:hypothetical protein